MHNCILYKPNFTHISQRIKDFKTNFITSSSWQEEEEDQAAAPHPLALEAEAGCSHPIVPRSHRLRCSEGRLPRKDRVRHERFQPHQKTVG